MAGAIPGGFESFADRHRQLGSLETDLRILEAAFLDLEEQPLAVAPTWKARVGRQGGLPLLGRKVTEGGFELPRRLQLPPHPRMRVVNSAMPPPQGLVTGGTTSTRAVATGQGPERVAESGAQPQTRPAVAEPEDLDLVTIDLTYEGIPSHATEPRGEGPCIETLVSHRRSLLSEGRAFIVQRRRAGMETTPAHSLNPKGRRHLAQPSGSTHGPRSAPFGSTHGPRSSANNDEIMYTAISILPPPKPFFG